MLTVLFETHATSVDNESGHASGHHDAPLSERGERQALELGARYNKDLLAVYCSDLQRSYRTAEIAFANREIPIVRDARLRECNYGEMAGFRRSEVMSVRENYIDKSFPKGESYRQAAVRLKEFLDGLCAEHDSGSVLVIGHRTTQYSLEHWLKGVTLQRAVTDPWEWQPGWTYHLDCIQAYG